MITERDVRFYLKDRTADDHILLPDIAFTSEDIAEAMKIAARRYNSVRPYVDYADPTNLPDTTNMFLDGIAGALFDILQVNYALNDIDYNAGSVQVHDNLLKNSKELADYFNKRFIETATQIKVARNLQQAYGSIG